MMSFLRSGRGLLLAVLAVFLSVAGPVHAKDVYVLISGGGTPSGNNYSQFLQARAYTTYLHANFPRDSIFTFFGAGNQTGKPPILSDVVKTETTDGRRRNIYLPGPLPGNRPAYRAEIISAFKNEILPAVRNGGTLYLLVGDHGSPSRNNPDVGESVITLFGWDRDPSHPNGWREYAGEDLGTSDLQRLFMEGLGKGKVVFVMSQCFSGGFHYVGLPRAAKPNPAWFTREPAWAKSIQVQNNLPAAAGFTATDDRTVASGCTPDVDSNRWAGYERYLPEQLVGLDLFDLSQKGTRRWSFYDAHVEATKVDQTIDKPRSTSEMYLATWARTLARMKDDEVTPAVKPHLEAFRKALDGTVQDSGNAAMNARKTEFQGYLDAMTASNGSVKDLLTMNAADLLKITTPAPRPAGAQQQMMMAQQGRVPGQPGAAALATGDQMLDSSVATDLFTRQIVPAWRKAIDEGKVPNLSPAVIAFERQVLGLDNFPVDPNASAQVTGRGISVQSAVYWHAGYGNPAKFDDARAREIEEWAQQRNRRIAEWARTSSEEKVRVSAEIYAMSMPGMGGAGRGAGGRGGQGGGQRDGQGGGPGTPGGDGGSSNKPDRKTAAERVQFYREVMAAWQFLLAVNEKPALDRVAELTKLERTPLRK